MAATRLGRGHRLVRHVQPEHDDRHALAEHQRRGVRVDVEVELGGRRDVAEIARAAHQHDAVDLRREMR
jgi:hypothetical protein